MKRFWASSLVVCALLGISAGTRTSVAATVRHVALTSTGVAATVRSTAVTRARVAPTVRQIRVTPPPVAAAVRHIAVDHSPAPPLGAVEIGNAQPTSTAAPTTSATACAGAPPSAQIASETCDPQNQAVRLEVLRIPAP